MARELPRLPVPIEHRVLKWACGLSPRTSRAIFGKPPTIDGQTLSSETQALLTLARWSGSDGFFAPDQLVAYTAMQRDAGWGKDIPDMLRNEEWNYAIFTPAKQHRPGVNQAECLACHKPLDKASYTFTLDKIAAAK